MATREGTEKNNGQTGHIKSRKLYRASAPQNEYGLSYKKGIYRYFVFKLINIIQGVFITNQIRNSRFCYKI